MASYDQKFNITWHDYDKNLSKNLSSMQQDGDFVDMTLAADGHFVKVHQMVIALASPYLKDLITSARSTSPVNYPIIILNKVSHETLCSLLEYIYSGEVLVTADNVDKVIEAGRELHIKGFDGVDNKINDGNLVENNTDDDTTHRELEIDFLEDEVDDQESDYLLEQKHQDIHPHKETKNSEFNANKILDNPILQYTITKHGNLQLVLNRYLYILRYKSLTNGTRKWRCSDYNKNKCSASVFTKDNRVVHRTAAHTHPFHDAKIIKKVRLGAIFTAVECGEIRDKLMENKNNSISKTDKYNDDSG